MKEKLKAEDSQKVNNSWFALVLYVRIIKNYEYFITELFSYLCFYAILYFLMILNLQTILWPILMVSNSVIDTIIVCRSIQLHAMIVIYL